MNAIVASAAFTAAAVAAEPTANDSRPLNWVRFPHAILVVSVAALAASYCLHCGRLNVISTLYVAAAHLTACAVHSARVSPAPYTPSSKPFLVTLLAVALAAVASIAQ